VPILESQTPLEGCTLCCEVNIYTLLFYLFAGHYTGHFKSVVTKPQNVYVLRDIMANGYRGGGNAAFFDKTGDLGAASRKIQERLNFDNQDRDEIFPSLLAFPMSVNQAEKLHNEISITSRLLPWDVHDKVHKSFPGGQDMYDLYNGKMSLEQVHFGEDLRASENMEYMSQVRGRSFAPFSTRVPLCERCPDSLARFVARRFRRARRTTRSASRARTACTTRSPEASQRWSPAWATGAPTRARAM